MSESNTHDDVPEIHRQELLGYLGEEAVYSGKRGEIGLRHEGSNLPVFLSGGQASPFFPGERIELGEERRPYTITLREPPRVPKDYPTEGDAGSPAEPGDRPTKEVDPKSCLESYLSGGIRKKINLLRLGRKLMEEEKEEQNGS